MDVVVLVKDVPNQAEAPPEVGADHLLRRDEPAVIDRLEARGKNR
jgi:hypothetical protein